MVQRMDIWAVLLMLSWLCFFGQVAIAQNIHADIQEVCKGKKHSTCKEYELKGAYIYHFFKYIEWKNEPEAKHFVISILGQSPIEEVLFRLEKEQIIRNKTFEVHHFNDVNAFQQQFSEEQGQHCHLLFISKQAQQKLDRPDLLQVLAKKSIILLGESNDFLDMGGDINFIIERNRLKFQINQKTLSKSTGLRVSAKLLKLAVLGNNYNNNEDLEMYSSTKIENMSF